MRFIIKYIFTSAIFLSALNASLYGQSIPEAASRAAMVELESEMSAPQISPPQLISFQKRAEQKLDDFMQLVSLISNPDLDTTFRKEFARSFAKYFHEEEAQIDWYYLPDKKSSALPLTRFFEKIIAGNKKLTVDYQELTSENIGDCPAPQCSWRMFFKIVQKGTEGKTHTRDAVMNMVLKMEMKKFGSVEKEVWQVYLGELEEVANRP